MKLVKTAYYYFAVEPLIEKYEDVPEVKPLISIPVKTKSKTFEVSFFALGNQLHMLRIAVPNLEEDRISEEDSKVVQTLKEHVLSVLRITYDHGVSLFPIHWWSFAEEGKEYRAGISIREQIEEAFRINAGNIRNVFVSTFPLRYHIALISDSQDRRIPLQYRYLSLYKILELEFKKGGRWNRIRLNEFLSRFEKEFQKLHSEKIELRNYLHSLRDKCAHVRTGKDIIGVTQLSGKDIEEVTKFLPFMAELCSTLLNEKYKDKGFSIVKGQQYSEFLAKGQNVPIN